MKSQVLYGLVLAVASFGGYAAGQSVSTTEICMTRSFYHTDSTISHTISQKYDVTKIQHTHSTTTTTPAAVTVTKTDHATRRTTVTVATNTATLKSTITTTVTRRGRRTTRTLTSTVTSTTTSSVVSTVSAAQGFLPIQTTLPQSENDQPPYFKRDEGLSEREPAADQSEAPRPFRFKYRVKCNVYQFYPHTITVTRTGSPRTVTAAPSTSTVDTTRTTTLTRSVNTGGFITTTTQIISTTLTKTRTPKASTTTTTVTEVDTIRLPTATAFAQCAPNNFATSILGSSLYGPAPYSPQNPIVYATTNSVHTAVDCCNRCAMDPKCEWGMFDARAVVCYLDEVDTPYGNTCDFPAQYQWSVLADAGGVYHDTFFNGNCGRFTSLAR